MKKTWWRVILAHLGWYGICVKHGKGYCKKRECGWEGWKIKYDK